MKVLRDLVIGSIPSESVDEPTLEAVVDHRLHGLLNRHVSSGAVELAPEQSTQLKATMLVDRTHRNRLNATVARAAQVAGDLGVDVAAFKGLAVEARWYAESLERPCSDLDLLLAPQHWERADELVRMLQPDHVLAGSVARLFADGRLQSVDVRLEDGTSIDLHADLFKIEIPMRGAADVWNRDMAAEELGGTSMRVVPDAFALAQLLLHLNKDRFSYLLNVADVVRVARSDVDWDAVSRIARAEGVDSHVFGALRRVMDWTGGSMPDGVRTHGSALWRALWPAGLVGQGGAGIRLRKRRQLLIPITARGRAREAVTALWKRWVRVDPAVKRSLGR